MGKSPGKPEKPGILLFMRLSGYPVSKNGPRENRGTGQLRRVIARSAAPAALLA
jgi:hypothetical protein